MSRARITLSFKPNNPQHMKAYATLMNLPPGIRSDGAIAAINRGQDMDECVYAAVVRALKEYQPQINREPTDGEAGSVPQDMLDFAFSL